MLKFILLLCFAEYVFSDSINSIEYGGKIPTEGYFDVVVNYSVDDSRDIEVRLLKPSEKNKEYAKEKVEVEKGYTKIIGITVEVKKGIVPGDYVLEVRVRDGIIFKDQTAFKSETVRVTNGTQGFTVGKDGLLYDANKKEFIIRGIANAHAEFDSSDRWLARSALSNIAATKANTVRIIWKKTTPLSTKDLDTVLDRAVKSKLIPLLELSDAVGSNDQSRLNEVAYWLIENIEILVKYRKYILVKIASQWGTDTITEKVWRDSYEKLVETIRDAGYSGVLVIDAHGNGQNPTGIKKYGDDLLDDDPYENLLFSIHMLSDWSQGVSKYKIASEINDLKSKKIPFIVGGFADKYPARINNACIITVIDAPLIMKECVRNKIGYIGTNWVGNGNSPACGSMQFLDVAPAWNSFNRYSPWGNTLINTLSVGIRDSSKVATVF